MNIQLKNKHIYFAVESVWDILDYKLKYQINSKCTADSADETIQTIDVNIQDLQALIRAVNNQPQGIAREINPEMFISVVSQLQAAAGSGNEEAQSMLTLVQGITTLNDELKNNKIISGKERVLS